MWNGLEVSKVIGACKLEIRDLGPIPLSFARIRQPYLREVLGRSKQTRYFP